MKFLAVIWPWPAAIGISLNCFVSGNSNAIGVSAAIVPIAFLSSFASYSIYKEEKRKWGR